MDIQISVALISLVGTALGTVGGILMSSKLTLYRIEQLEKKMDKHNTLIERMYEVEKACTLQNASLTDLWEELQRLKGR
jgi:hypothetical protein